MPANKELLRILDANFNRAKEGLRVCEDVARFVWNDPVLSKGLKTVRHGLTEAIKSLGLKRLVLARDIEQDVGRPTIASELKRPGINDVFWANSQRVKESLRVLEELGKLMDVRVAKNIKLLRYQFYAIEQKAFKQR